MDKKVEPGVRVVNKDGIMVVTRRDKIRWCDRRYISGSFGSLFRKETRR